MATVNVLHLQLTQSSSEFAWVRPDALELKGTLPDEFVVAIDVNIAPEVHETTP